MSLWPLVHTRYLVPAPGKTLSVSPLQYEIERMINLTAVLAPRHDCQAIMDLSRYKRSLLRIRHWPFIAANASAYKRCCIYQVTKLLAERERIGDGFLASSDAGGDTIRTIAATETFHISMYVGDRWGVVRQCSTCCVDTPIVVASIVACAFCA